MLGWPGRPGALVELVGDHLLSLRAAPEIADLIVSPERLGLQLLCRVVIKRSGKRTALVAALASAALASACGSNEPGSAPQPAEPASANTSDGARLEHIHGLGVSSADRSLFIATHNGLFRAPPGSRSVEQVSQTGKDVMGFSVASPDRFLGSGHPAPEENLPPNLGLIESRDQGRTWQPVSLLGQVDFHVLRSSGQRVYGVDSATGQFFASGDRGRTWSNPRPPAPVFDLALAPGDAQHLVAASEQGLLSSRDGGRSWTVLNGQVAGLLAWPTEDILFLVDAEGRVHRSSDEGRSFQPAGDVAGQPVAFMADGEDLYVALDDATVKGSADGGATWTVRAAP